VQNRELCDQNGNILPPFTHLTNRDAASLLNPFFFTITAALRWKQLKKTYMLATTVSARGWEMLALCEEIYDLLTEDLLPNEARLATRCTRRSRSRRRRSVSSESVTEGNVRVRLPLARPTTLLAEVPASQEGRKTRRRTSQMRTTRTRVTQRDGTMPPPKGTPKLRGIPTLTCFADPEAKKNALYYIFTGTWRESYFLLTSIITHNPLL
jgi:hypothetical protein